MSIVHCLTLEQVENCQIHKMQEGSLLLLFCQHSTNADEYEYGAPVAIKERRDGESGLLHSEYRVWLLHSAEHRCRYQG